MEALELMVHLVSQELQDKMGIQVRLERPVKMDAMVHQEIVELMGLQVYRVKMETQEEMATQDPQDSRVKLDYQV
mgnify:CR=1 FL=1